MFSSLKYRVMVRDMSGMLNLDIIYAILKLIPIIEAHVFI